MKNKKLIWIDLEMTGLDPNKCFILEVGILITNINLNILCESFNIIIHQDDEKLLNMDKWNTLTHTKNGLLDKVRKSNINEKEAEKKIIDYISKICLYKESPMCGNNISHDRKFLLKYMPFLEDFFNYKHIDVNSIKEFVKICKPNISLNYKKKNIHRALFDVKESIKELIFYKKQILNNNV
ncbi:oligoribonuclease [Candidatus Nardonella dryophthoridicola]|uniref:Oligoribonuclease n=1 Tax=endosymbiont of Rhynchophorus ferrugineus TaxID=1972133 RepID=A0A2Z5T3Q9_9GAMM|nr:oligoribonuclease [Candidatus Nardonella dryophthoridicola]QTJ62785.1 oligoribonuclease [Candidatus Nardonella dryophthoridicola]BBA85028.1 oligoribonuclease [endosymbiont of Rhynchophorus ferrugineus]